MENRASYILVGAFVIALIATGFVVVLWLASVQFDKTPARYLVNFRTAVTGLQVGSPVRYRGIPVGRVSELRFDPDNIEIIRVTLEIDETTPIKEDTFAQIGLQGITGIAFIQLDGGTRESPLRKPATGNDIAEIPSRASGIETLLEKAPELFERSVMLVDQLSRIVDDNNVRAIAESLESIRQTTAMVAKQSDRIDRLVEGTLETVGALKTLAGTGNQLAGDLLARIGPIGDQARATLNASQATVTEFRTTAQAFSKLAREVEQIATENRAPIRDFSAQGLYELSLFLIEARQLVTGLNRLATQFERDPARFLFGDTQRGFEAR